MKALLSGLFFLLAFTGCAYSYGYEHMVNYVDEPIRWQETEEIQVIIDESMAEFGDLGEVQAVLQSAFDEWTEKTIIPMGFNISWGYCDRGFEKEEQNVTCIYSELISPEESPGSVAKAYVSWAQFAARINDVDIVFYSEMTSWTLDDTEVGKVSLKEAATHEIGHLLGMAHSDDTNAIMYPHLNKLIKGYVVELTDDDIIGVNELYNEDETEVVGIESCSIVAAGTSDNERTPRDIVEWICAWILGFFLGWHLMKSRKNS